MISALNNLRRTLAIFAFAAWLGGFFFYASFVVPIGTDYLGSRLAQGVITFSVSKILNNLGILAICLFILEEACDFTGSKAAKVTRILMMFIMAITLIILFNVHTYLSSVFDRENLVYTVPRSQFKYWHGFYLWVCTAQWLAGMIWVWLSICKFSKQTNSLQQVV